MMVRLMSCGVRECKQTDSNRSKETKTITNNKKRRKNNRTQYVPIPGFRQQKPGQESPQCVGKTDSLRDEGHEEHRRQYDANEGLLGVALGHEVEERIQDTLPKHAHGRQSKHSFDGSHRERFPDRGAGPTEKLDHDQDRNHGQILQQQDAERSLAVPVR
jgi:hypothetical protein